MKTEILLKNGYIMMKAIERKENENTTASGFILPESMMEDDQVSQGVVIRSCVDEYKEGEVLFFHKTLPIDALIKFGNDVATTEYLFIKGEDVICKVVMTEEPERTFVAPETVTATP